jgi:choline dehydrogenase-like flavoprotein
MADREGEKADDYPKLSRPFESMKSEYDVIVVGSGYGAGVAASRMARAGKTVAVLELGWERRRTLKFHRIFIPGLKTPFIVWLET